MTSQSPSPLYRSLRALTPTGRRVYVFRQWRPAAKPAAIAAALGAGLTAVRAACRDLQERGLDVQPLPAYVDVEALAAVDGRGRGPFEISLYAALHGYVPAGHREVRAKLGLARGNLDAALSDSRAAIGFARAVPSHIHAGAQAFLHPESTTDSACGASAGDRLPGPESAWFRSQLQAVLDVDADSADALLRDYAGHWRHVETALERYPRVAAGWSRVKPLESPERVFRSIVHGLLGRASWYRDSEFRQRPAQAPRPAPEPAPAKPPPEPPDVKAAWERMRAAADRDGADIQARYLDRSTLTLHVKAVGTAGRAAMERALAVEREWLGMALSLTWHAVEAQPWPADWTWERDARADVARRCTDNFARLAVSQARADRLDIDAQEIDLTFAALDADDAEYADLVRRLAGLVGVHLSDIQGGRWKVRCRTQPRAADAWDRASLEAALAALDVEDPRRSAFAAQRPDACYRTLAARCMRSPEALRRRGVRNPGGYVIAAIQHDYDLTDRRRQPNG